MHGAGDEEDSLVIDEERSSVEGHGVVVVAVLGRACCDQCKEAEDEVEDQQRVHVAVDQIKSIDQSSQSRQSSRSIGISFDAHCD